MPVFSFALNAIRSSGQPAANSTKARGNSKRKHQDHIADPGHANENFLAMVHKPVPLPKAMRIPEAKAAVTKEWDKLEKIPAWHVNAVQPRADVEARAKRNRTVCHFGNLMALCHLKNSELAVALQAYKGRVVFRGDGVTDEDGYYAVFSEQGTSSSHMAATKYDNDNRDVTTIPAVTHISDVVPANGVKAAVLTLAEVSIVSSPQQMRRGNAAAANTPKETMPQRTTDAIMAGQCHG